MRNTKPFVLIVLALLLVTSPGAHADPIANCNQLEDRDRQISGCGLLISDKGRRPEFRAIAYFYRGNAYAGKGEFDRAIADYSGAIELNAKFPEAYANRARIYSRKGNLDRAIADYSQAIRLDAKNAKAYGDRGLAHYRKGDREQAIADIGKAIQLDPNNKKFQQLMAAANKAKGQ
jgi:tetratricopeptide (TPR) repeat protein